MTLHAVANVTDAFAVTRSFLTPFDARRWVKLAAVAFFVGGGTNLPSGQFGGSDAPEGAPPAEVPATLPADVLPVLVVAAAALVGLAVAFWAVGSIMEFVFVESLRRGDVTVRRYWRDRWRQGLRLFGFRVAIGLPVVALVVGWLALVVVPQFVSVGTPAVSIGAFLLGIPALLVVGLLYGLVDGFTTAFVVPIMVLEDCGVLAGWRRLWASLRADWKEYLAYAVLSFVLTVALGFLTSLVLGIAAVALAIPLAAAAAATYVTVSFGSTVGVAVLAALAVLFVLAMVVLWALVQVPVVAYLRYYALLVLGDVEPSLDLVPDRRAAARE